MQIKCLWGVAEESLTGYGEQVEMYVPVEIQGNILFGVRDLMIRLAL